MNTFTNQRGQILIIFLTALFVGGSSLALGVVATGKDLKEINKSVKVHVQEPSRQQKSLVLLEQWKDEAKERKKDYKKQRKALVELFMNHDADKAAFKPTMDELLDFDNRASERLLDIQYGLRKNMTREEWDKVFSDV